MKGNNFTDKVHSLFSTHHSLIHTDKVFSRFTSHFSLKRAGATHVALCDSVGSNYRHWCGAFTLAEVLVTLGIIGVVSAMTVPTLMQNYQRQSYVTQLHKVYNELSQAFLRYQTDKNALSLKEAGLTSQAELNTFVSTYFKIVQNCSTSVTPCIAASYKKMDGSASYNGAGASNCYAIGSGAAICPRYTDDYYYFIVDVNGAKGPNILGRDLFTMFVYGDGSIDDLLPEGATVPLTEAQRNTQFTSGCVTAGVDDLHGCFGKILNDNWQMTY